MKKTICILTVCNICSGIIGYVIGSKISEKKIINSETIGTLRIDNSDSDNPNSLFLELKVPVSYISSEKIVKLKVLKENYIRK